MSKRVSIHVDGQAHDNPIPNACRKGSYIVSSGIFGLIPDRGKKAGERKRPETIEHECVQMFRNLQEILKAAGGSTDDIIGLQVWVTDRAYKKAVNAPWQSMFPDVDSQPARDTDEVESLSHGCRVLALPFGCFLREFNSGDFRRPEFKIFNGKLQRSKTV